MAIEPENNTQTEVEAYIKENMLKRGRKPRIGQVDYNVWDDPQYRKDYYNEYYRNKRASMPKESVICECGKEYKKHRLSSHKTTKHHILYMEFKEKGFKEIKNISPL